MKTKALVLSSAALAFTASSAIAATTLANPSFENPALFNGDGNNDGKWNSFAGGNTAGPSVGLSSADPRTGSSHVVMSTVDAEQFAGFSQDIEVNPGDDITIDLYHYATAGAGIEVRYEWFSGGAGMGSSGNTLPTPGSSAYENFSLTHTVPAGMDGVRVVYVVSSWSGDNVATANVDDFTVSGSTVPEPSGVALLSLCALGFLARRKRS